MQPTKIEILALKKGVNTHTDMFHGLSALPHWINSRLTNFTNKSHIFSYLTWNMTHQFVYMNDWYVLTHFHFKFSYFYKLLNMRKKLFFIQNQNSSKEETHLKMVHDFFWCLSITFLFLISWCIGQIWFFTLSKWHWGLSIFIDGL